MQKTYPIYAVMLGAVLAIMLGPGNLFLTQAKAAAAPGIEVPKFEVDASWPKPLPDLWVTGEVGGTCIDSKDHVFIVSRTNLTPDEQKDAEPAPPVIEFDPEGNVVNSWGVHVTHDAAGNAINPKGVKETLPKNLHGCTVDDQDNVWIAGNQDGIVQKYSHDGGKLLLQIGTKGKLDTSDGTPTGYNMNSSETMLDRPACIAIDPTNGDIYIADGYGNKRVVVFDREGHFLRQWGKQGTVAQTEDGVGGVFLDTVHCVVIDNAGLVYVCDRKGDRIEVFDKMGNFKKNIVINKGTGYIRHTSGSAWWIAFSRDKDQRYMYVADGGNELIWILDHATGQILGGFSGPGHQAGSFSYVHTISVDSKGDIIAGETINGRRVQKFTLTGYEPTGHMPQIKSASGKQNEPEGPKVD